MSHALLLSVRFDDGRYHGRPEWPPSPARLFQALVAGAAKGGILSAEDREALIWLQQLAPPVIVAPAMRDGKGFTNYVPNNDLDSVGGDPGRISEIRSPKFIKARLFDARKTLLYAWPFSQGEEQAKIVCEIAERVYQLGRSVDIAWAWAEIIDDAKIASRLSEHGGSIHRPAQHGEGQPLPCPQQGSLESLEVRFEKSRKRFSDVEGGRKDQQVFSQAPRPRFNFIVYDSPPRLFPYDLRQTTRDSAFAPWPLTRASKLIEGLRDRAAQKLKGSLPDKFAIIDRILIGRDATEADKSARIRIIPLPSIGSSHVVRSIRRVLVEVPANCPLLANDVAWAFSGLDVIDADTGEVKCSLVPGDQGGMLNHYGIYGEEGEAGRVWRTITPAALPERAARRRIDPSRLRKELEAARLNPHAEIKEAKNGRERQEEEGRAAASIIQALRHVGVSARAESIRLQREPFDNKEARAESFAEGTRFVKERLWHVEIVFDGLVRGPLVIGDGRYLGLGVMAPQRDTWRDGMIFAVTPEANIGIAEGPALLNATRRALMALSRDHTGHAPRLFAGHEEAGGPAASGRHEHIFLSADDANGDGLIDRLVVTAPWVCDGSMKPDRGMRKTFDEVVSRLVTVRAGRLGVVELSQPTSFVGGDPLFGPSRVWESRTPYHATRHAGRRKDPAAAIALDVIAECARRSLPRPEVEILNYSAMPNGGGLTAHARLRFAAAVCGPILLGRDSHKGGGMFAIE